MIEQEQAHAHYEHRHKVDSQRAKDRHAGQDNAPATDTGTEHERISQQQPTYALRAIGENAGEELPVSHASICVLTPSAPGSTRFRGHGRAAADPSRSRGSNLQVVENSGRPGGI